MTGTAVRPPLLARGYAELHPGDRQATRARTVTEADVVTWCGHTGDGFWLHTDAPRAAEGPFGQRIAPGVMVYAFGTGLGVPPDSATIIANYGADRLRYPRPTLIGDTIHTEIEVLAKEDRPDGTGVVTFRWDVLNQNGETVCASQLKVLMGGPVLMGGSGAAG
jgi:acyl dehydratase